jgi:hypothetical protein
MTLFEDYHFQDQQSNVASRTRSHTPPITNTDKKQLVNLSFQLFIFKYNFRVFFREILRMGKEHQII